MKDFNTKYFLNINDNLKIYMLYKYVSLAALNK